MIGFISENAYVGDPTFACVCVCESISACVDEPQTALRGKPGRGGWEEHF